MKLGGSLRVHSLILPGWCGKYVSDPEWLLVQPIHSFIQHIFIECYYMPGM